MNTPRDSAGPDIPQGFAGKMIDSMPSFVTGLIGSFLGIALSIAIVLKVGGMDVAFSRVVNAYATALETRMAQQTQATAESMAATFAKLDREINRLNQINDTVMSIQTAGAALEKRMIVVEEDTRTMGERLQTVVRWACSDKRRPMSDADFCVN